MESNEKVLEHRFNFHPRSVGDSLSLETDFYWNGDQKEPNIYTNQEIRFTGSFNHVSFVLYGLPITPENLRELANELEQAENVAIAKIRESQNAKKND